MSKSLVRYTPLAYFDNPVKALEPVEGERGNQDKTYRHKWDIMAPLLIYIVTLIRPLRVTQGQYKHTTLKAIDDFIFVINNNKKAQMNGF